MVQVLVEALAVAVVVEIFGNNLLWLRFIGKLVKQFRLGSKSPIYLQDGIMENKMETTGIIGII